MPPQEVAQQLLRILRDQDWPKSFQTLPQHALQEPASESYHLLIYLGALGPKGSQTAEYAPGTAFLLSPQNELPSFATSNEHRWIGIQPHLGSLVVSGASGEPPESWFPFTLSLETPADWPFWRQAQHASHFFTRPFVSPKDTRTLLPSLQLFLHMVEELIEQYPWKGGRIRGTDLEINAKSVPVANALQFIRKFLHRPLNRADVASAVGVSESYLTALFKDRCNTNLTEHMLLERIMRADNLLMHTRIPVAEIGDLCGFSSTTYFIRAYRKLRDHTPLKIRQLSHAPKPGDDWAQELFYLDDYEVLAPTSAGQAEGVSNLLLPTPRFPLVIANAGDGPIQIDWQSEPGGFQEQPGLGPLEMGLYWNIAPSAWRIRRGDEVLGHFVTKRAASQIVVAP